ncbi:hypothetical protein FGO68_gene8502 [Halteria grandinella]|uniref:14-3-3 domain-containing protein n=1 Tax=Halteria grandinella TaxID=5974 RepID=A0A8J8T3M1_HALGN|nr:hypothetical protein FGO68_gene8502 [Halteria grandinella]
MFMARVAEQGDRFEDMFSFLKDGVIKQRKDGHFTADERNLLSVAFKNLVSPKRTTWRTIIAVEHSTQGGPSSQTQAIAQYKAVIEERLHKDCEEIVALVLNYVLPRLAQSYGDVPKNVKDLEERAFFWKMAGDYYRYASEASQSTASREQRLPRFKKGALEAYNRAMELCKSGLLRPYNSVCLGLALNFSVFHYEVMGDPLKACQIAKESFESAIEVIDECSEEHFQEAQSILELLKENMNIWAVEAGIEFN